MLTGCGENVDFMPINSPYFLCPTKVKQHRASLFPSKFSGSFVTAHHSTDMDCTENSGVGMLKTKQDAIKERRREWKSYENELQHFPFCRCCCNRNGFFARPDLNLWLLERKVRPVLRKTWHRAAVRSAFTHVWIDLRRVRTRKLNAAVWPKTWDRDEKGFKKEEGETAQIGFQIIVSISAVAPTELLLQLLAEWA